MLTYHIVNVNEPYYRFRILPLTFRWHGAVLSIWNKAFSIVDNPMYAGLISDTCVGSQVRSLPPEPYKSITYNNLYFYVSFLGNIGNTKYACYGYIYIMNWRILYTKNCSLLTIVSCREFEYFWRHHFLITKMFLTLKTYWIRFKATIIIY